MIYLVDMDGVLADTVGGIYKDLLKRHPNFPAIPYEQNTCWDFPSLYTEEQEKLIREIWRQDHFFRDLEPLPGALEGIQELSNFGDVLICTYPTTTNRTCMQDKYDWVKKHLSHDWARRTILTKDKSLVYGDMLIDDKPNPEENGRITPSWQHIVYDQPWNRHVKSRKRMTWQMNWKKVLEIA